MKNNRFKKKYLKRMKRLHSILATAEKYFLTYRSLWTYNSKDRLASSNKN